MKLIPIFSKKNPGLYTKVSDEDYGYLSQLTWIMDGNGYVQLSQPIDGNRLMSRIILNLPPYTHSGLVGDHIDGDKLNNQRENLRACTHTENKKNRKPYGSSKYLGVYRVNCKSKIKNRHGRFGVKIEIGWKASIRVNGKKKQLGGLCATEEEAALLYNVAAKRFHGEFANLNKINIAEQGELGL